MKIKTIVFDLGGVLIDWNPDYLYRKIISDAEKRRWFLENVCTPDWNEAQDGGRTIAEANAMLIEKYPGYQSEIEAFYGRWTEMLNGSIAGTVEILRELYESEKYPMYALTNWSAETWPFALERFEFLQWFDGIVVSGTEKKRKPFADFYQILFDRYDIDPVTAIFIDDNLKNVAGSKTVGMEAIHFQHPAQLREELEERKIF